MRYLHWQSYYNCLVLLLISGAISAIPEKAENRLQRLGHPIARRLFEIMWQKETNVCLALDVHSSQEFLQLADLIGPYVCCIKTHVDIIDDFTHEMIMKLKELSKKHNFLILEDRKFADIGAIAQRQYTAGIYKIAEWADLVTVHALPGVPLIEALVQNNNCGLLLIAQLSSAGNLINDQYTNAVYNIAKTQTKAVIGFIAQHQLHQDESWLYFAPGINNNQKSDDAGQIYRSFEAVISSGIDVLVIGRAIYQAQNPLDAIQSYKTNAWQLYSKQFVDITNLVA